MAECIGVFGKLFGHKYKTVFETKSNPPSLEEAEKQIKMLSTVLSPIRYVPYSNTILPSSISQRKQEIQEYNDRVQEIISGRGFKDVQAKYELCSRCGDKLEF